MQAQRPLPRRCGEERLLLVGVVSWRTAARLEQRDAIRALAGGATAAAAGAVLRFVMAADSLGSDASTRGDVLAFAVSTEARPLVGKLQLINAFLRFAVSDACERSLGRARFVAHADDDALFSLDRIAHRLALEPAGEDALSVTGPHGEWYMWDADSMTPTCWAFSSRRWEVTRANAAEKYSAAMWSATERAYHRHGYWNKSDPMLIPRAQLQCLRSGAVGPFPIAKGFFVAYSRGVAERLARWASDASPSPGEPAHACGTQAHALANRSRPLLHPVLMKVYPPEHARHPAQMVMLEDVWHACLLYVGFRHRRLTLVNIDVSEWTVHSKRSGRPPLMPADVYHKLRSPKRFQHVSEHREALLPRAVGGGSPPTCLPLTAKMRLHRANATEALGMGAWRWCEFRRSGKSSTAP